MKNIHKKYDVGIGNDQETFQNNTIFRSKSDNRSIFAALVVWIVSGSSISLIGDPHYIYIAYFAVQFLICVRSRCWFHRGSGIFVVFLIYAAWTIIASLSGMEDQFSGLVGMTMRMLIVFLPMVFLERPIKALIDVMALICVLDLPIYFVRQIGLLAHFDIANLFTPIYSAIGQGDRSILIFNFHTVGEEHRNAGFFREPGMFAENLAMASILISVPNISMTFREKKRKAILFFVSMLTTQSTAGLAVVPLVAIVLSPYFIKTKAVRIAVAPLLASIGAVAILLTGFSHLDKISNQINSVSSKGSSWYNTRFGNFYVDSIAIAEKPFLGYGFSEDNRPRLFTVYNFHEGDQLGFGNGLSGTVVKFGVVTSGFIYATFFLFCVYLFGGIFSGIVVFVALGMMLFSQQILLLPAIYTFLCFRKSSDVL